MTEQWGERLSRVEERILDLRQDFAEHLRKADERSDRVREVEAVLRLLVEAQKEARRQEASQYRVLVVSIQRAGLAIAFAGVLVSLVAILLHHT